MIIKAEGILLVKKWYEANTKITITTFSAVFSSSVFFFIFNIYTLSAPFISRSYSSSSTNKTYPVRGSSTYYYTILSFQLMSKVYCAAATCSMSVQDQIVS